MENEKRFLSVEEIRRIQLAVEKKDSNVMYGWLHDLGERLIWSETWSRETGHQWHSYRWTDNLPKHETDYADLEERELMQIKDLSSRCQLDLFLDIAKYGEKGRW